MEVLELTDGGQQRRGRSPPRSPGSSPRPQRTLELALYDIRLPGAPGEIVAGALRAAAGRGVEVRLLYNVDSARPAGDPPAAGHPARAPARAADRRPRGARDPRPDAPQVRRPRPRGGLDRLGELDDRLVDAPGERLLAIESAALARGLRGQLRGAVGAPRRRALRPDRAARGSSSTAGPTARAWFTPGQGADLSQAIARGDRDRAPAGADRLARDHLGADPRHPGRARRPAAASTSPASSTSRRPTPSTASGRPTGSRPGRSRCW